MQREIRNGEISHATIVWGGTDENRLSCAEYMAARAVCARGGNEPCGVCAHCLKAKRGIHPDIAVLDRNPDNRLFSVDQVRALRDDSVVMPNEASQKVYILNHADSMNTQAQNAMLKLLEEPPAGVIFILLAETPAALLPTVRSRCVLRKAAEENPAIPDETARAFCDALGGGPLKLTAFSFSLDKLDKNGFRDFIAGAKALIGARLKDAADGTAPYNPGQYGAALIKAVRVLDRASGYLDCNVSSVHLAGMICAELLEPDGKQTAARGIF